MDFILITVVVIAIFTGAIAVSKGRSFLGWLVLGALFPLIALIAVAAMPSLKGQISKRDGKQCPSCAEMVRREAAVCRHCGHQFDLNAEYKAEQNAGMVRVIGTNVAIGVALFAVIYVIVT